MKSPAQEGPGAAISASPVTLLWLKSGSAALIAVVILLASCAPSRQVRDGQRLFAGCAAAVDDKATLAAGVFVCKGPRTPAPFAGNGRACGTCHVPGDNFGLSTVRIAALPADDPLFFELDEDQALLRTQGLVHVIAPGIDELRQIPKLVHLRAQCKKMLRASAAGDCDALGLRGDRVKDLNLFNAQAVANHLSKTPARVPGVDFMPLTAKEMRALTAYQLSVLVSGQDERNAARLSAEPDDRIDGP